MVSVERREELESLLRSLGADERKWLQQNLLRRETAGLLCEATSLSEEELLTAENWFRRQFAEADCLRMRRSHARLWCLFMLLRYGGLRLVEALSLELRHMDWDSGSICLEGDRARRVPLPWAPCRRLRQLLEDPSLFPPSGRPLQCDASHVRRSLKQCGQACGLPAGLLTARSLRQARILELIRQGLDQLENLDFAYAPPFSTASTSHSASISLALSLSGIQRILTQSVLWMDIPLPRVTNPMISSPGTGLQHLENRTDRSWIPFTVIPDCFRVLAGSFSALFFSTISVSAS